MYHKSSTRGKETKDEEKNGRRGTATMKRLATGMGSNLRELESYEYTAVLIADGANIRGRGTLIQRNWSIVII